MENRRTRQAGAASTESDRALKDHVEVCAVTTVGTDEIFSQRVKHRVEPCNIIFFIDIAPRHAKMRVGVLLI